MKTDLNERSFTLPIFPIPVFLLPDGIMRLRIYEQRYLKMIKIASKGNGFVIYLKDTTTNIHKCWGSWVDIINFHNGDDNVLEVDVRCKSLVKLSDFYKDSDLLQFAECQMIIHWSQHAVIAQSPHLSNTLNNHIEQNKLLSTLYPTKPLQHINWVLARWLELLPIDMTIKNTFIHAGTLPDAKELVESIIIKNKN